jgi:hypothetical protein
MDPRRDVPLSLADIDPDDTELIEAWDERQLEEGYARVLEIKRDMQARGIIDEHGNRVRKELPEAMLNADRDSDVV